MRRRALRCVQFPLGKTVQRIGTKSAKNKVFERGTKMATKKIILVDDDENIRKTFFLLLGKKYRIYPVKDAREALAMSKSTKADLVIADYVLPAMNGLELIKKLRESGFAGGAVLISGHPEQVGVGDMSRLDISAFFVKPLDLDTLNLSIDRILNPKTPLAARA